MGHVGRLEVMITKHYQFVAVLRGLRPEIQRNGTGKIGGVDLFIRVPANLLVVGMFFSTFTKYFGDIYEGYKE